MDSPRLARRRKSAGQLVDRKTRPETSSNLAWRTRGRQGENERGGAGSGGASKEDETVIREKRAADITLDFSFRRVRSARARARACCTRSRIQSRRSAGTRVFRGFPSELPPRLCRSPPVQFVGRAVSCAPSRRLAPRLASRIDDGTGSRRRQFTGPRYRSYFSSGVCDRQTIPADGHSAFRREFGSGARRVPFVCRAALV